MADDDLKKALENAISELPEIIKRQRRYASFFECSDKERKELGLVELLFKSMQKKGKCPYSNPKNFKPGPPDCTAEDEQGNLIGIEVTELVDKESVERNENGEAVYRLWDVADLIEKIESIIKKKDAKLFNGRHYKKTILLIFTDEKNIVPFDYIPFLQKMEFSKKAQIDEAYFLFSYQPWEGFPFVKLNLKRGGD
jgi:hypothetical protein